MAKEYQERENDGTRRKLKIIEKSGHSYIYVKTNRLRQRRERCERKIPMGRGYDATRTWLKENPKILKELEKKYGQDLKKFKSQALK